MHTKLKYLLFILFLFLLETSLGFSQEITNLSEKTNKLVPAKDSVFDAAKDTINKNVSSSRQKLEDIAYRKAKDYEKLNQKNKTITLYNQAEFKYQDFELKAGIIVYDYQKKELLAGRIKDSLGNLSQRPYFKQGNEVMEPDSIRFNMESKKSIIWNTRTTHADFRIKAERTKKQNDSVYFMKDVIFTTAEDLENPEYYFKTRKVKVVPKKKIVSGVTNMVIADVPTPLGLPFAFFPMSEKSVSGFLPPTPGEVNGRGYFLQNGGYYFALGQQMDLTLLGDYYTNGSFMLQAQSNYAKRYRFNGNFNFRFENLIEGEMGFADYFKAQNYNLQWSHSQDSKANPTSRFSASVNLGSSNYYRQSMNTQNIGAALNNTLSSSISYSKTFQTVPQINMSITATHSQNVNTKSINMTLPTVQASIDRIYPFAPKNGSKKGFLQNINLQYNFNARNQINTTDSLFFTKEMFQNMESGVEHSIPISTNFKILKYLSVSMSGNYQEVWYLNTYKKYYSKVENRVVDERVNGFDAFRTYNLTANLGTTIYGTFNFSKTAKIQGIRHVIRPSVSYSYTPSFEQYYDTYAIDAIGTTMEQYTRFERGIYGSPGLHMSNMLNFNVGNNFEAKVRDDKSPTGEAKKVMLLNALNFSTSYNMTSDSLKLAPVRMSAGTQIFDNKLNINFGATLDPYSIDNSGVRINKWNMQNGGSLFRLTSANITLNYSLSSNDPLFGNSEKQDETSKQNVQNGGRADDLFGKATNMSDRRNSLFGDKQKKEPFKGFFNTDISWDLTMAYSLTYNNNARNPEITNNSIMASGNITLSPGWKVGFSSGYDFKQKGVTYTQLRFERDLKSWRMDFSWVPNGLYKQWSFFIGIKSNILQDIKYEKRSTPENTFR